MNESWIVRCGRRVGPVLISSLILTPLAACSGASTGDDRGASASTSTEASSAARFDGETLARGLLFGTGPAVALFGATAGTRLTAGDPRLSMGNVVAALQNARADFQARGDETTVARLDQVRDRITSGALTEKQLRAAVAGVDPELLAGDIADEFVAHVRAEDPTYFDRFETELRSGDPQRLNAALEESSQRAIAFASSRGEIGGQQYANPQLLFYFIAAVMTVFWAAVSVLVAYRGEAEFAGLAHDELVNRLNSRLAH